MATEFYMVRDINGYNGFGLMPSDTAYSCTLAINTDTSLTVPAISVQGNSASTLRFRLIAIIVSDPGATVWVSLNQAANAPAGASFASTSSAMNPAAYQVKVGDVLHFYATTANINVSVRFYWINS